MSSKKATLIGLALILLSLLACATTAQKRLDRGLQKSEAADYAGAIIEFDKAIALDPAYAEAYNQRGIVKRRGSRDAQGAIADFTRAIELKPHYAQAYNNRCLAWNQLRDWRRMADDASKAVELNPRFGAAIVNRAIAYHGMGDHERALADYSLALRVDPEGRDGLDAYFHRGDLNYRLQRYDAAISDLNACRKLAGSIWPDYPHLSDIHRLRGRIHIMLGDWSNADSVYAAWDAMNEGMGQYDVLLWHIARQKTGADDREFLQRYAESADPEQWPYPVYQMFLGTISLEDCVRAAGGTDPEAVKGNRCEAYFYIAEKLLGAGDEEAARAYFEKCLETQMTRFLEFRIAGDELERMK
jgi:lipoprotein NlpI